MVRALSGRLSWRYADAFQRSIISEAIYHFILQREEMIRRKLYSEVSTSDTRHHHSSACSLVASTNLWAYLVLIEAAHSRRQSQFVLLGTRPLTTHVDDRHSNHSKQNNTAQRHAHRHANLLASTAHNNQHHLFSLFLYLDMAHKTTPGPTTDTNASLKTSLQFII